KPVKAADLLEAIRVALDAPPQELPAGSAAIPAAAVPRDGLRVLLADDNPVNRRLGALILERQGFTVVQVEDGVEAVAALEREHFDLVLMEVQMPNLDGFAATAAVRKRERMTGKHVPIVALTAHALKGDRERCLEAGMDGYLTKPIKAPELLGMI